MHQFLSNPMIKFKSKRQEREFNKVDPRIKALTFYISLYFHENLVKLPVVTSVLRTQREQSSFYRRGLSKIKRSPHMYGRAIDIRLRDIPKNDAIKLVNHVNMYWQRRDKYETALAHGKGAGYHLHIQVPSL